MISYLTKLVNSFWTIVCKVFTSFVFRLSDIWHDPNTISTQIREFFLFVFVKGGAVVQKAFAIREVKPKG